MSCAGTEAGTKRHSALPKWKGWSPRWIKAALETIARRRCANGGPTTNGWVSKLGQGAATTASRVGCGMSSSLAIVSPLQGVACDALTLATGEVFYNVRSNIVQAGWPPAYGTAGASNMADQVEYTPP